MNFLDTVLPVKKEEVKVLKKHLSSTNRFARLFENSEGKFIFIAEIKPKSPSAGKLILGDPLALVAAYEKGGADAISVLTDSQFFGGGTQLFAEICNRTDLPLLRKEFIIDESQIVESLKIGADAVLLIVQLVTPQTLKKLITFSKKLGLVPLVEVINESELQLAINCGAEYIGVNSRDLRTMQVDPQRALALLSKIPSKLHGLLFSGIENSQQIKTAVQNGAKGFLIGTSLIKASNPTEKLLALREATGDQKDEHVS